METFLENTEPLLYAFFLSYVLLSTVFSLVRLIRKSTISKQLQQNLGLIVLLFFILKIGYHVYFQIETLYPPEELQNIYLEEEIELDYEYYAWNLMKGSRYFAFFFPLGLYLLGAFLNLRKKWRVNYIVILFTVLICFQSPFGSWIYMGWFNSGRPWSCGEFISVSYNFEVIESPNIFFLILWNLLLVFLLSLPMLIRYIKK